MDTVYAIILLALVISLLLGGVIGAFNKDTRLREFVVWELVRYVLIDIFLTASLYRDAFSKHVQIDFGTEFLKLTAIILPIAAITIMGGIFGRVIAIRLSKILKQRKGDKS